MEAGGKTTNRATKCSSRMSLEEHLDRYSAEGAYDGAGGFTLDREKALGKLAGFSLSEWREVLFSLGAWITLDGGSPILFDPQPKLLVISREKTKLTAEHLEHLEDYVLTSGNYHGLSQLALARHIWQDQGKLAIEVAGLRRIWEKGKTRVESSALTEGVRIELSHRRIDLESTVEFLSKHFGYTPYPWAVKGLSMSHARPSPRDVMLFNLPPLAVDLQPGIYLEGFDNGFQMLCQWNADPGTSVVVEGVNYPLYESLNPGLSCVVFCDAVQRSLTKSDAIVARRQREVWSEALSELLLAFIKKPHFWEGKAFLSRHKEVLLRRLWPVLERPEYLRAAQRILSTKSDLVTARITQARVHVLTEDYDLVRNTLLPLVKIQRSSEEEAMLRELQDEFSRSLPAYNLSAEELDGEIHSIRSRPDVGRILPTLTHATLMSLAKRAEELGLFNKAEGIYLDAYFLPQGECLEWSIHLERSSFFDSFYSKTVLQRIQRSEVRPEYIGSLISAIALAQIRQSPLRDVVEAMYRSYRFDLTEEDKKRFNQIRLEAWRLHSRREQKQWYDWLLMGRKKGWKPQFPPPSFEEYLSPPSAFHLGDSVEARRTELRARTLCLEYAALAHQAAVEFGNHEQSERFKKWLSHFREVVLSYAEDEEGLLPELARASIELGDVERASTLLRRAICKRPPGDLGRLPLLVDLAILHPSRAGSVLNGIAEVLNLNEAVHMTPERRLEQCVWPFPYELPARIHRLSWSLAGAEQVRTLRLASLLYDRMLTQVWKAPSERDWVKQALSELGVMS